jgi:hypothetical protein
MKKILLLALIVILSISALGGTGRDKFNNLSSYLRPYAAEYLDKGRSSENEIDVYFKNAIRNDFELTTSDFKQKCRSANVNSAEILAKMTAANLLTTEETLAEMGIQLTAAEEEEMVEIAFEMVGVIFEILSE